MSDHQILVRKLPSVSKHPNADTLGIVIMDGYPSIIKMGTMQEGSLVVFIPPDFIYAGERIKKINLRKVKSYGLVLLAPEGTLEGENVMEKMGITRWVSKEDLHLALINGRESKAPFSGIPTYDVLQYRQYSDLIPIGADVRVTEKIHGSNMRMVFHEEKMYVGSHRTWREFAEDDPFWITFNNHPKMLELCKAHPEEVFYGEMYGHQKGFPYNCSFGLVLFDIWKDGKWVTDYTGYPDDLLKSYWAPILYEGPMKESLAALCDGNTQIPEAHHIREGIVIRDIHTTIQLKVVSDAYLEKS